MKSKLRLFVKLLIITLIPTFLLWLPFILKLEKLWTIPLQSEGMATIVANYDGPLYIVIAKTLYNPELIKSMYSFPLPVEYYAAHFPLFPLLIKMFSLITYYPYSMLIITLASSFLSIFFFYKLASDYVDKKNLMWLTFVFSIFPARWLIVRSVGSPEPLFVAAIIASSYYFNKKNYLSAGIWGVIAQFTKSPGSLLFIAYILAIAFPTFKELALTSFSKLFSHIQLKKRYPIFFIPLALLLVFIFYKNVFNDFLAYFHSGNNIHLFFPPFQIFNYSQPWVNTFWLEEVVFVYLFGILGLLKLIEKKEYNFAWLVGVFFTTLLFVSHRDIIRYGLPIVPFLLIAFSDTIVKKEFKIAMAILIIPIYLFSIVYISQNVMPIADWSPLL
jgi:Gpi18-like mannosyltransferase